MKHIKVKEKTGNMNIRLLSWSYVYDNAKDVIMYSIPYSIEIFSLRNILDQLHEDVYKKLK